VNILMATTEAVPFVKTGGLGDVCGSLPQELARLGHHVDLILPAFRQALEAGVPVTDTGVELDIPVGSHLVRGQLLESRLPGSPVRVWLVKQDAYFDRDALYGEDGVDYKDNCERFVFFSRAVLESIRALQLKIDLVHANDWQTGLVPAYLKLLYRDLPEYESMVSLFTIHNLAYQGNFWHWDMLLTGIDWKYFNWQQMEYYGDLSFLKTGLTFADAISAVSPRYAKEIQSAPLGCGMEGILQHRREVLTGILNGVDYDQWSPTRDPHLATCYDADTHVAGKQACKQALQRQLGLPEEPAEPLLASIGRLVEQKGFDLLAQVIPEWVQRDSAQWVILGTGQRKYHDQLQLLAERYPKNVAVQLTFSTALAHQIQAGADMLVMPSRYEPCGLNQLYGLRYGTVPVVRATGGLADTIQDVAEQPAEAGAANGYCFREASALALGETLRRACDDYRNRKPLWNRLVQTAMRQDWSWARSASRYAELYAQTISRREAVAV